MKKSIRLYLEGVFQPLFFKTFIKNNAEKIGIRGFMRNLESGEVEIFIEGDGDKVDKMIEVCKQGPKHAKIRKVREKKESFQGFKDFKILQI